MRTDSQVLNSIAKESNLLHYLTQEESDSLKRTLLSMYKDISSICIQYSISFMLAGGSCLGAIRHKGFIPWDDDLDIMMPRGDYERFVSLCQESLLSDDYEIESPSKSADSKTPFLKIYRKNTIDNELYNENTPFPKGIFIDIFPMAAAPNSHFLQRIRAFISDSLLFISTCVLYSQYPSKKYREFAMQNKESRKRYRIRLIVGNLFGIIKHKWWAYWFDSFNASKRRTKYQTIPNGRNHYYREILPYEAFFPVRYVTFEGLNVPVPNNYHLYLTNLYGDYLSLPPEDKRERHLVYQFKNL